MPDFKRMSLIQQTVYLRQLEERLAALEVAAKPPAADVAIDWQADRIATLERANAMLATQNGELRQSLTDLERVRDEWRAKAEAHQAAADTLGRLHRGECVGQYRLVYASLPGELIKLRAERDEAISREKAWEATAKANNEVAKTNQAAGPDCCVACERDALAAKVASLERQLTAAEGLIQAHEENAACLSRRLTEATEDNVGWVTVRLGELSDLRRDAERWQKRQEMDKPFDLEWRRFVDAAIAAEREATP